MANELRHSDVGTALSKSEWEAVGGHIFNSQAAGDIMYASTTSQLTRLGIGTANQVLAVNSGATAPEWVSGVSLATNVTVSANNSTDETVYPVFVDGATGTQGAETDTGLTYNPNSGVLTATQFTGAVSGTASLATSVTASANNSTDETTYPTFVDGATGTQGIETDTGLTYNPSSGVLTATQFTGAVSGTASLATLASTVTVIDSTDTSSYIAMFDSATGSLAAKTDAGLTYNAGTGMLTATGLTGPLTGVAATATALASARTIGGTSFDGTANIAVALSATATALASARTINGVSFDGTGNITVTAAGSTLSDTVPVSKGGTGATSLADKAVLISQDTGTDTVGAVALTTSGQLIIGGSSGPAAATLTAGSNITISNGDGSISIAASAAGTPTAITVADTTDTSAYVALFDSATGDLGPKTDAGITYNAGTGMLTATGFTGPLTGTASTATVATTVTITDNEDTDEDNAIIFTAGGDVDGGNIGLESDGTLTYNPSDGKVTATGFVGTLTGNVTGNTSGSSGSTTGNAATATALATGRTIGGVSFDGTANIAVTLAATATALASARTINGVSFDGTGNITVTAAGSTLSDTVTVAKGGTGATSLTDGGILLGSGTSAVTAMAVLADGGIVVGDGSTDPVALAAFTGSTGTLKHERGGIEADISAIAKGGIVTGSGTGSMAIRTVGTNDQVLTADSSEGTGVKWADAGGGGTVQFTATEDIAAGAPVALIDSSGAKVENIKGITASLDMDDADTQYTINNMELWESSLFWCHSISKWVSIWVPQAL